MQYAVRPAHTAPLSGKGNDRNYQSVITIKASDEKLAARRPDPARGFIYSGPAKSQVNLQKY
jgi:hypothetical protein